MINGILAKSAMDLLDINGSSREHKIGLRF